ncbi:MAG: hydroxyethylthiazole kinase [Oscillibacter sp.]|nr:hydroxyethylthiazole kinase [Oscillibacter sp.]
MDFGSYLTRVREQGPLIQCITNFVTVNDCANILLATGASPSMAEDIREAAEAARGASALVCNLGAIDKVDSMIAAGQAANEAGHPVVLDPVAAGSTTLRQRESAHLLETVRFTVIRGNASEIRALARGELAGSGVDVGGEDAITESSLPRTVELAKLLANKTGAVVAVSGPIDVLSDGERTVLLRNGCATMARITGSGCMLTAVLGAFCGAAPDRPFEAACAAVAAIGVAGELAEQRRLRNGTGNATFRTDLIDAVFNLTPEQLNGGVRYEIYQG